jgi:hypothetical protein
MADHQSRATNATFDSCVKVQALKTALASPIVRWGLISPQALSSATCLVLKAVEVLVLGIAVIRPRNAAAHPGGVRIYASEIQADDALVAVKVD